MSSPFFGETSPPPTGQEQGGGRHPPAQDVAIPVVEEEEVFQQQPTPLPAEEMFPASVEEQPQQPPSEVLLVNNKATHFYELELKLITEDYNAIDDVCKRRLVVDASLSLWNLHCIIQTAFGWEDTHLHQFEDKKNRICYEDENNREFPDERSQSEDEFETSIVEAFSNNNKVLYYEYDFGDNWEIRIELKRSHFSRTTPLPKVWATPEHCQRVLTGCYLLSGSGHGPGENTRGTSSAIRRRLLKPDSAHFYNPARINNEFAESEYCCCRRATLAEVEKMLGPVASRKKKTKQSTAKKSPSSSVKKTGTQPQKKKKTRNSSEVEPLWPPHFTLYMAKLFFEHPDGDFSAPATPQTEEEEKEVMRQLQAMKEKIEGK